MNKTALFSILSLFTVSTLAWAMDEKQSSYVIYKNPGYAQLGIAEPIDTDVPATVDGGDVTIQTITGRKINIAFLFNKRALNFVRSVYSDRRSVDVSDCSKEAELASPLEAYVEGDQKCTKGIYLLRYECRLLNDNPVVGFDLSEKEVFRIITDVNDSSIFEERHHCSGSKPNYRD